MNSFESWWYRPNVVTGSSMFDIHGLPTGLARLCFKAGEMETAQQKYTEEDLRQARVNSALRSLALLADTRPICSADGCSERESCGTYCRDQGNFK